MKRGLSYTSMPHSACFWLEQPGSGLHAAPQEEWIKVPAFAMTSAEGVPRRSVMSSSWCTTLRPGNSGFPSRISAKMQPMDQMSMAVEYFAKKEPHSSGARYLCVCKTPDLV